MVVGVLQFYESFQFFQKIFATVTLKFICIDTSAVILRFKFTDTSQFNI